MMLRVKLALSCGCRLFIVASRSDIRKENVQVALPVAVMFNVVFSKFTININ